MTKQWEENKSQILEYYQRRNKPLHEVMQLMGLFHSFHASARAYRQHFQMWGISKYNRKHPATATRPAAAARAARAPRTGRQTVQTKRPHSIPIARPTASPLFAPRRDRPGGESRASAYGEPYGSGKHADIRTYSPRAGYEDIPTPPALGGGYWFPKHPRRDSPSRPAAPHGYSSTDTVSSAPEPAGRRGAIAAQQSPSSFLFQSTDSTGSKMTWPGHARDPFPPHADTDDHLMFFGAPAAWDASTPAAAAAAATTLQGDQPAAANHAAHGRSPETAARDPHSPLVWEPSRSCKQTGHQRHPQHDHRSRRRHAPGPLVGQSRHAPMAAAPFSYADYDYQDDGYQHDSLYCTTATQATQFYPGPVERHRNWNASDTAAGGAPALKVESHDSSGYPLTPALPPVYGATKQAASPHGSGREDEEPAVIPRRMCPLSPMSLMDVGPPSASLAPLARGSSPGPLRGQRDAGTALAGDSSLPPPLGLSSRGYDALPAASAAGPRSSSPSADTVVSLPSQSLPAMAPAEHMQALCGYSYY